MPFKRSYRDDSDDHITRRIRRRSHWRDIQQWRLHDTRAIPVDTQQDKTHVGNNRPTATTVSLDAGNVDSTHEFNNHELINNLLPTLDAHSNLHTSDGAADHPDFDLVSIGRSSTPPINSSSTSEDIHQALMKASGMTFSDASEMCIPIIQNVRKYINRTSLTGLLILYGSIPLSCSHYVMISSLVGCFASAISDLLPSNIDKKITSFACSKSKVRTSVISFIHDNILPSATTISVVARQQSFKPIEEWVECSSDHISPNELPANLTTTDEQADDRDVDTGTSSNNPDQQDTANQMKDCFLVSPAEWSKYDISNSSFLQVLKEQQQQIVSVNSSDSIRYRSFSNAPITINASAIANRDRYLWVRNTSGESFKASIGDELLITSHQAVPNTDMFQRVINAGWDFRNNLIQFNGKLSAIWNAGSKQGTLDECRQKILQSGNNQPSLLEPNLEAIDSSLHCIFPFSTTDFYIRYEHRYVIVQERT